MEKIWNTKAGLRALMTAEFGFDAAYVGLPVSNPLYMCKREEITKQCPEISFISPIGYTGVISHALLQDDDRALWWIGLQASPDDKRMDLQLKVETVARIIVFETK